MNYIIVVKSINLDSGLLEVLIPAFEKTGYKVKSIAVCTGNRFKALMLPATPEPLCTELTLTFTFCDGFWSWPKNAIQRDR